MSFPLEYCPNGYETLERLRRLHEGRDMGLVCAAVEPPSQALAEFARSHKRGFCDCPDIAERARFWDRRLSERAAVRDDSVPSVYLTEMDQGLFGGMLRGDVRFICDPDTGWISSMVSPLIEDWDAFADMRFDPQSEWFQRYVSQLDMFVSAAQGKFGLSHLTLINGVNFLFELFGATRSYMELIENPDMVEKALDLAFEFNLAAQKVFFDRAPLIEGGTCSNMGEWLPGRIVSESLDPFHMTSVEYFERWGRGPVERIIAEFDGGAIHIHGNGRHLLGAASSIVGLKAILLGDDKGFPPAFGELPDIRARVGDMPLMVGVEFGDFRAALDARGLTGGVLYQVTGAPGPDEANSLMDRVRAYRA